MRKLLLFSALLLLIILTACEDEIDRSFTIDKVTIDAQIDETGLVHVQELFTYTFDGEFNGVTRELSSNVEAFKGYVIEDDAVHDLPINKKEPLSVEYDNDEEYYKIFSKSNNETKTIMFEYVMDNKVKKYKDIGEFTHSFFNQDLEVPARDVSIVLHAPEETITGDTHFFLKKDEAGTLEETNDGIVYYNEQLQTNAAPSIKFLFPAETLSNMKVTKDTKVLAKRLAAEKDWIERKAHIKGNLSALTPIMISIMGVMILLWIVLLIIHPARYRGDKGIASLVQLFESTDPLLLSYVKHKRLGDEGVIAALFSLKRRRVVSFERVPSQLKEGEETYRLTWIKKDKSIDEADAYLKAWLFTEETEQGMSFLLEKIMDNPEEDESVRKEKGLAFDQAEETWGKLALARVGYSPKLRRFRGFDLFTLLSIVLGASVFYYFITFDMLTPAEQITLKIILALITLGSVLFSRYKLSALIYFVFLILFSLLFFTLSGAGIWAPILFAILCLMIMILPSEYPKEDRRRLKFAMKTVDSLIWKKEYPVGSDVGKIENQLMQAIVIGMGTEYVEQCGREEFVKRFSGDATLLGNPQIAAETFSNDNVVLYSALLLATTTSTAASTTTFSSPGGGGGTGAF